MSYIDTIEREDVRTVDDLIEYVRARYGCMVTWKERAAFKHAWKGFAASNPHVTLETLIRVVDWGKDQRRKIRHLCGVFTLAEAAYAAGALPEIDETQFNEQQLDDVIFDALGQETDPEWRRRLMVASGAARQVVVDEWRRTRAVA